MVTPTMNGSASTAVETCSAEIREILQAAACGTELTFEQGLLLATAQGSAMETLVAVADELRRETVGDAITYVVNRNINFTNVCFVGCSFAALDAALEPRTPIRFLSRKWCAARAKPGNAAPQKSASRAGYPATSTDFSTAICCAPSSTPFPRCTCMHSPRWKSIMA